MKKATTRDQIREILQLHSHPDLRAEILACFDEMSGEPTQQQVARWCEEIRGFQRKVQEVHQLDGGDDTRITMLANSAGCCERAALRIASLHISNDKLGEVALRANNEAEALRDQLAYACHQLARIAGAIDETGEALMTGWGEARERRGERSEASAGELPRRNLPDREGCPTCPTSNSLRP